MTKQLFRLATPAVRQRAIEAIKAADDFSMVEIKPETRNNSQNAALWPILDAFAKQLKWPVNGEMVTLEADEWKSILSAAFKQETARVAMGLNGGMVMLGMRTSKMPKAQFSEFLEFLNATAALRGVSVYAEAAQP